MSRDDHPRIDAEEHPEDYFTITADGFVYHYKMAM